MVVARSVTFPKYVATIDDKQRLGTPGCGHTFREVSEAWAKLRYRLQVCVPNR